MCVCVRAFEREIFFWSSSSFFFRVPFWGFWLSHALQMEETPSSVKNDDEEPVVVEMDDPDCERLAEPNRSPPRQGSPRQHGDAGQLATERERQQAAAAALARAEEQGGEILTPQPTPGKKKKKDELRDVTAVMARGHVGAKLPTNSTGVRGLDYSNSLDELTADCWPRKEDCKSEFASLLRRLSDRLLEYRTEMVHSYRVRVVLTLRCFMDVIKVLLRHDEKARALWFNNKAMRLQLATGFMSYMAAGGKMRLDMTNYPEAIQSAYWGALQHVSRTFEDAVAGWQNVSGTALSSPPSAFNAQWRSANVQTVVENDELVPDKQGSKIVTALLAVVTSEHDFCGEAAQQFKQHRAACKKMLAFLVARGIARFPGASSKDQQTDGDDDNDDDDARLQAAAEAAFKFEEEMAVDASFQPREDAEARVEGEAVLDLEEDDQERIVAFSAIAERVVNQFAKTVRDYFPCVAEFVPGRGRGQNRLVERQIAAAIQLPACTATDRRKVVYVAHIVLDNYLINSRRQLGTAPPSGFYLSDFAHVHDNMYIGDAGGAFHAGPAGFTLVVNCASAEVPNHFEEFPLRNIEYVSLPLPGGPAGIGAMSAHDWQVVCTAVDRHKQSGKILVHCLEGRHRSAGIVYHVLQTCFNLDRQTAFRSLFRASPLMDFVNVPHDLFSPSFDAIFGDSLACISFERSMERVRITYGDDNVLPVTTLTPFYTFTSGRVRCSLVDYLIEFGVKRFGFARVADFFANHVASALVEVSGPIYLVCYPPHSPGADTKVAPIIHEMCRAHPDRFVDATNVLVRTQESPQRSRGGDRSIELQLKTISCTVPRGAANATFVCLDDVLNTGSSLAVFAQLMTRAGVSGDNLRAVALGHFTAHGPGHETQSDFVIPSTSIASDVSVAAPPDVCIDVPESFDPPAILRCTIVCQRANYKTLAFPTPAKAVKFARAWLDLGMKCCPHFAVEDAGFPAQLVSKAANVVRVVRAPAKSLFVLSKVGGAQGRLRNDLTQGAHKEWNDLGEEGRAEWVQRSAVPVSAQDVRNVLRGIYPPGPDGDVTWEMVGHGGGNIVRFCTKKALNAAFKEKKFGQRGFCLERAFGAIISRVWISSSLRHDDALGKIQSLSNASIVCTLKGSSLTAKTLMKHDGGVLNVTGDTFRVECPLIKWGCDATWSATMQFCNENFLGLVSWNVLKDIYLKELRWREEIAKALELYFCSLEDRCTANRFGGLTAHEAAQRILKLLALGNAAPQQEIDAVVPLLALFHFSRKDIYRCMMYRDKLRGLSTAGGTLIHVGLHIPGLPWTGNLEAQKTTLAYRELSGASRESAPFPLDEAESRIAVLRSLLDRLPIVDENGSWMKGASVSGVTTKSGAQEKFMAARKLLEAWRRRLIELRGIACELPSLVNAPGHLAALAQDLRRAFDECKEALGKLARVRFPVKVEDDSGQEEEKVKKVSTGGLTLGLNEERNKVEKQLLQCRAIVDAQKVPAADQVKVPPLESVSAMDAVKSTRGGAIKLIGSIDSGLGGDYATVSPEPSISYAFDTSHVRNLASWERSVANEADPAAAALFSDFRLNEHTLRFQLTSGLAKEARNTINEQTKMTDYVTLKNERIAGVCHSALSREFYPIVARNNPLTQAGRRVAESLLELANFQSIMSAPHDFLGSSSTMRSLQRVESILLRSVPLCNAYSVPLYRDARGQTRRAVDKLAQMQINYIELVTLKYAHDPIVQLMHRLSHGENVKVEEELGDMVTNGILSPVNVWDVLNELPVERAEQLPYLIIKSCEVLRALQGSLVNYSKRGVHDEIAALRTSWSRTGKDPPQFILCQGTWNRAAPGRGSFGSAWHRAKHQRATTRNLIRRAKQIRWHLEKKRLGQESSVTDNFLQSVSIQSKRISEIRSTKQKLSFAALLSHERIDTQGPPQSLFPGLAMDRPWKLRWSKGDDYVVHRDHMASCALAILGMWERYAFAYNQIQEHIDASRCVLLRPAVYLYHTDYDKWSNGTLQIKNTLRW